MDLNTICIGLLFLPILYSVYIYYNHRELTNPALPKALWGEQVGRSKNIQSKTGDASLFIQSSRRTATKNGGFQRGFMSAAIDYFFISRICPCTKIPIDSCKCKCCDVMDGGGASNIFNDVFDGGYTGSDFTDCNMDGGNVIHGQNCGCCPNANGGLGRDLPDAIYSGGAANTQNNSNNLDGGNV